MKRIFLLLVVTMVLLSITSAKAFYDPSIGRWVNRDPLGDHGFITMVVGTSAGFSKPVEVLEGANLFRYVKNSPTAIFDAWGLACGSGITDKIVPDKPFGFDFTPACVNHDKCYGTCGKSKSECDEQFQQDMLDICENKYFSQHGCNNAAYLYYGAVNNHGGKPYKNAQKDAGCCEDKKSGGSPKKK